MINLIKKWTLLFALTVGFLSYHLGSLVPHIEKFAPFINQSISAIQPCLIFCMLFLTYLKIDIRHLQLARWQLVLLCCQIGPCLALALLIPHMDHRFQIWMEAAILCLICPTATAAAVVTEKLKGNVAGTVTYTLLINVATATIVPLLLPLFRNIPETSFTSLAGNILLHTFPLLTTPLICALGFRYLFRNATLRINQIKNLAFYLWAVSLSIAMGVTAQNISKSGLSAGALTEVGVVSLACCVFQFATGKLIGRKWGEPVSAGQSFGQKNIIFAIWLGNSFFNPATVIAGGCYSIWHNLFNTWQIYRNNRKEHDNI